MREYFVHLPEGIEGRKTIHVVGGPCERLRVEPNYHSLGPHASDFAAQQHAKSWNHFATPCPLCCA